MLLLTSKGHKTRKKRITSLSFMMNGSNYVIIASNGGIKKNPGWFYNLKENKDVTIRIKDITKEVKATITSNDERNRLWPIITAWGSRVCQVSGKDLT